MNKIKSIGLVIMGSALPLLASAQGAPPPSQMAGAGTINTGNVGGYMANLINWVFFGFIILAVIFILLAAFSYLTAGGDEEKISKAKNELIYAIIAIIIAVLAKTIVSLVVGIGGGGANTGLQ